MLPIVLFFFYFVCVGMKVKVIGKAYAVSGLLEIPVWPFGL